MSAVLRVVSVGPQVTLQDAGRVGAMRFGVPRSGPMDRGAFALATAAVEGRAAVEVSRGGLVLDCVAGAAGYAVAGGGFVVECGGVRRTSWHRGVVRAGDRIAIRPGFWGSWCYLAFAEVEGEAWMGRWRRMRRRALAGVPCGLGRSCGWQARRGRGRWPVRSGRDHGIGSGSSWGRRSGSLRPMCRPLS